MRIIVKLILPLIKNGMKYILYFLGFVLLIWAIIEQTKPRPNIYIQIAAVAVFFMAMMKLTDKTPGKYDKKDNDNQEEN